MSEYFFTFESVSESHPDKLVDHFLLQISYEIGGVAQPKY